jgi:hypothetical protein
VGADPDIPESRKVYGHSPAIIADLNYGDEFELWGH